MRKVMLIFVVYLVGVTSAQIGTTDEQEVDIIEEMIGLINKDSCDKIGEDVGFFCCASQPILGVFERLIGLKSNGLCQLHQTMCLNKNCEAERGLSCGALSCPELSEKEKEFEKLIQSEQYSDSQFVEMLLPYMLIGDHIPGTVKPEQNGEQGEGEETTTSAAKWKRHTLRSMTKILKNA